MNTILKIAQTAAVGFPILVSEVLGFWVPIRPQGFCDNKYNNNVGILSKLVVVIF